jgi:hypothetical protein
MKVTVVATSTGTSAGTARHREAACRIRVSAGSARRTSIPARAHSSAMNRQPVIASTATTERGRQPDARRRTAIAPRRGDQIPLEVVVRGSKRGRTRTIPLHAEAHDALRRWYIARPEGTTDALFVSLRQRQSAVPERLSASAVGDVVAKHASAPGVREDRRAAHASTSS